MRRPFPAARWNPLARTMHLPSRQARPPPDAGTILVISAGTSDLPVAEEAAVVAEVFGHRVERLADVGVAGIHRLLASQRAAPPGGRHHRGRGDGGRAAERRGRPGQVPVIAVPTSVGYGASLRWPRGAPGDAQLLRGGRHRGQHRQRLRRRGGGQPDLRAMTIRTVVSSPTRDFTWLDVVDPTREELSELVARLRAPPPLGERLPRSRAPAQVRGLRDTTSS